MEMGITQSVGVELRLVSKGIVSIAEFTATEPLIVSNLGRTEGLTGGLMEGAPGGIPGVTSLTMGGTSLTLGVTSLTMGGISLIMEEISPTMGEIITEGLGVPEVDIIRGVTMDQGP